MFQILSDSDICMSCGACCEYYRVSFYWYEMIEREIPEEMIQPITPFLACMVGTSQPKPRCIALEGKVGDHTKCSIYTHRPSACYEVNIGDDKCNAARLKHGLPPIEKKL